MAGAKLITSSWTFIVAANLEISYSADAEYLSFK
jgi:hypothetical protein